MLLIVAAFLLLGLCCAAAADDEPMLGMGRRHYLGEGRLDITYTTELATPHVDWADPYAKGPLQVYAIPSVMEGRTLVELMQRLSMKVDAVTIDPAWDVNKWTMSFGEAYGARAEQAEDGSVDFGFMYKYLEEDLTGPRTWDVMVMHGILGWGRLPEAVRKAIVKRVKEGMGLVLVGPVAGPGGEGLADLSALVPGENFGDAEPALARGKWSPATGDWAAKGEHYITRGVPLSSLPGQFLGHRSYRVAKGAQVIATAGADPLIAVRQVGKGRVVSFGYANYGLAPFVGWEAYGAVGEAWWETWYSVFLRSLVWAAKKEPEAGLSGLTVQEPADAASPATATVQAAGGTSLLWQLRDDAGKVIRSHAVPVTPGGTTLPVPMAELDGGRYYLDVLLLDDGKRVDWASTTFTRHTAVSITRVAADPSLVMEVKPSTVTAEFGAPLPAGATVTLELVDNYQRVLARTTSPTLSADRRTATASLSTNDLLTHLGWARATVLLEGKRLDQRQVRVDFATPERLRTWDDYEVNLPFYGPQNYYPWIPLADAQYRKAGMTWLMQPERNFRFSAHAHPSGLGVYHYDRKALDAQMASYWQTGERKYLERHPCFHEGWKQTARAEMTAAIKPYLKYRPFNYYVYDEPSLTSYSRAFDFCYSAATLGAFRFWLRAQYPSLKALNAEWGSDYRRWEQVEPPTTEEAQSQGRIPAWADFRHFMDLTFAEALGYTSQVILELDPGAKGLIGGTQVPTPFNGTDWWLFSQAIGVLEPYFGIDEFRSFNRDLPIIQACGYQDAGPELEEELWRRALRGQRGATVFWSYTFQDPDLALNSQGLAMARAFGQLRGEGVARLLLGGKRDDSRIAVLYSQPSMHAAWIQDGDIRSGRSARAQRYFASHQAWQETLHRLGFQFQYVSYQQLAMPLDRRRFDVLVLPDALALSDAEVATIKAFLRAGGTVLADGTPGRFDEHVKARPALPLPAGGRFHVLDWAPGGDLAGQAGPLLATAGPKPPAQVTVPVAQLVRYTDGASEYVALVDAPGVAHRVTFDHVGQIYDVRARRYLGRADHIDVPAGAARVALYALLPSRTEALEVLTRPTVLVGEAVDFSVVASSSERFRHVFAIRVYAPGGELREMYGSNLDAPMGAARGSFHLAWNDTPGEWRIVALDAATGASGEVRVTVKSGGGLAAK